MSRCLSPGLAVALGLLGGCRPYDPHKPVDETSQACCTHADEALQRFEGCRVTRGQCRMRKGEKFWMRGRVSCGPVDARCHEGRCCSYRPAYGTAPEHAPPDAGPGPSPDAGSAPPRPDGAVAPGPPTARL